MASKVRYVLKYGGSWYNGANVKKVLAQYSALSIKPVALNSVADVIAAAKAVNAQLWVFREPRELPRKRSRYKSLCHVMRLSRPRKSSQWAPPDVLGALQNVKKKIAAQWAAAQQAAPAEMEEPYAIPNPPRRPPSKERLAAILGAHPHG